MIFFSTLGGLLTFGVPGFIIGPIIAALFVTVWDIYAVEFKDWLPLTSFRPHSERHLTTAAAQETLLKDVEDQASKQDKTETGHSADQNPNQSPDQS